MGGRFRRFAHPDSLAALAYVLPRFPYLPLLDWLRLRLLRLGPPRHRHRRTRLPSLRLPLREALRSRPVTGPSTLLRPHLPPMRASLLSASWVFHLCLSVDIAYRLLLFHAEASSKVLPSLCRIRCGRFMPSSMPTHLSTGSNGHPRFRIAILFSTPRRRFTRVQLLRRHLGRSPPLFPLPFSTRAFPPKHRGVV